jgi:hypothetical protein
MIGNPAKIQDGVLGESLAAHFNKRDMLWSRSSIKSEVADSEELYVTIVELIGALVTTLYAYSCDDRINDS